MPWRRVALLGVLLPLGLALTACGGDDKATTSKSDGLVRTQDLSGLRPTDTQQGKSEDSAPSWPCTGGAASLPAGSPGLPTR